MASNNSGVWNQAGDTLDFSIDPKYYQTTWFLVSCVAAFLALLWALYRYRLHQIALEFNARLGDPETQTLMHRMESDFAATLLDGAPITWKTDPSVCVVMAAHGYPGEVRAGDVIHGLDGAATVFHAGTRRTPKGIETSGGRVLGVTASGATLAAAIDNAYAGVRAISFDGAQYRTDIGAKGLRRW